MIKCHLLLRSLQRAIFRLQSKKKEADSLVSSFGEWICSVKIWKTVRQRIWSIKKKRRPCFFHYLTILKLRYQLFSFILRHFQKDFMIQKRRSRKPLLEYFQRLKKSEDMLMRYIISHVRISWNYL